MRSLTPASMVVCVALVAASPGYAANNERARERNAKKACATGDFRRGVEILADLYVETDDVTYVYNQGRCYQQNHQWTTAIDRFREYLRKSPHAAPSRRAEAEKHIADCEALRAEDEPKPVPVAPPVNLVPVAPPVNLVPVTSAVPVASAAGAPTPVASESANARQPVPPKNSGGSGLRMTGVAVGSAGVVTAVVGLVLNLKANSLADDFDRSQDPGTRSSHSSYKTGSMICYGAGAGMIAAGAVMYLIGRSRANEDATQVSLLPVLTPTGFSLSARRAF